MPTWRLFSSNIHAANIFRVNLRSKITRFEAEPISGSATPAFRVTKLNDPIIRDGVAGFVREMLTIGGAI
jgi:hypothetical protein